MPLTVPVIRFVLEGTLGATQTWSTGWYVTCEGATDVTPATLSTTCEDLWNAFFTGTPEADLLQLLSESLAITGVKAYYYPINSLIATVIGGYGPATAVQGSSSNFLPYEVSLVATLQSASSGRSFRGRMYWPLAAAIAGDGLVPTAIINDCAQATADLLIDSAAAVVSGLSVSSALCVIASWTHGYVSPVIAVQVDNKPDSQRRRQGSIKGTEFARATVTS